MGEATSEVAVVGEEQQAGGVAVEPADGIDALWTGAVDEHHHGFAVLGVVDGGDEAFGLVEEEVAFALAVEGFATVFDHVAFVNLEAHLGDYFAVDGDAASGDELVGITPRANAGIGNVFVEAGGAVVGFGRRRRGFGFLDRRGLDAWLAVGCFGRFFLFVGIGTIGALAVALAVVVAAGGGSVGVLSVVAVGCVVGFVVFAGRLGRTVVVVGLLGVDFVSGDAWTTAGAVLSVASVLIIVFVVLFHK